MNTGTHFIQFVSVCVSELQSAELLVDSQDVVVELGREQQVLQGSHVLLDGHMVLQNEERQHVIERKNREILLCVRACV